MYLVVSLRGDKASWYEVTSFARGEIPGIFKGGIEDTFEGFLAVETDVWCKDDVVTSEEIFVLFVTVDVGGTIGVEALIFLFDGLFTLEDVQTSSRESAMIEGLYQCFVFDDTTTGSVDEEGARAEGTNIVPIDEVVGMLIVGHVEGDDVRLAEDLFERSIFEMEHLREKNVFLGIKRDDVHPKAFGDADDVESDMTGTNYPKRLVFQIKSHEALN